MSENSANEAFSNAYNNFDSRPLVGETLRKFYIDDFTKDAVNSIKTTIKISEKFRKMLVIGHRGCGKSTILNKVAEELKDDFYIISFSATETLNMNDVETIDILISIYLQVLKSMEDNNIDVPFSKFDEIMDSAKRRLKLTEFGLNLWKILSFKIKVENESREVLREEFKNQIKRLNTGISECISSIDKHYKDNEQKDKEVLIIIDGLDKLETKFAEKVFFQDSDLLIMPESKIIYTFPLETYYCEAFITFKDRYEDQFISLIVVNQEKNGDTGIKQLEKLVLRRINQRYIEEVALKEMILASGGLLRDLIKFMQDACKKAIVQNYTIINKNIAEDVINDAVNHYEQKFDSINYGEAVLGIMNTNKRATIANKDLIYLLRYLFVLEYKLQNRKIWYDVHPCLKQVINS